MSAIKINSLPNKVNSLTTELTEDFQGHAKKIKKVMRLKSQY